MSQHCVYFDTETGGVEPHHPTISLAAAVVDTDFREVATFDQRIRFDVATCDPEALKINHYTPEAWRDAITPAAAKFARFIEPYRSVRMVSKRTGRPYHVAALAGYNAMTFDLPRLKGMFGDLFFPCSFFVRDVLQRALFYFDERPELVRPEDFKLTTVAAYFGIDTAGAHDAFTDVRLTIAVHKALRDAAAADSPAAAALAR